MLLLAGWNVTCSSSLPPGLTSAWVGLITKGGGAAAFNSLARRRAACHDRHTCTTWRYGLAAQHLQQTQRHQVRAHGPSCLTCTKPDRSFAERSASLKSCGRPQAACSIAVWMLALWTQNDMTLVSPWCKRPKSRRFSGLPGLAGSAASSDDVVTCRAGRFDTCHLPKRCKTLTCICPVNDFGMGSCWSD